LKIRIRDRARTPMTANPIRVIAMTYGATGLLDRRASMACPIWPGMLTAR
jgi:hypothetical protein